MSCKEMQSYVDNNLYSILPTDNDNKTNMHSCYFIQNWLHYVCCNGNGILPLYRCQEIVLYNLFSSNNNEAPYNSGVAPLVDNLDTGNIDVHVTVHISQFHIANYGINGGTIDVSGTATLQWKDERLKWDPIQVGGCTKIKVKASHDADITDIWVPPTSGNAAAVEYATLLTTTNSKASIFADGNVSWDRHYESMVLSCNTVSEDMGKICKFSFTKNGGLFGDDDGINYVVGSTTGGLVIDDPFSIPGYIASQYGSSFSIVWNETTNERDTILTIKLDPVVTSSCLLCGGIPTATVRNDTIPNFFNHGGMYSLTSDQKNWTCSQINDYLYSSVDATDPLCRQGKGNFASTCCAGMPLRSACEHNIRHSILENFNDDTVTPPEPYPEYFNTSGGAVDVLVFIDFTHILDIDIRSNTLSVVVSIELAWNDLRLSWQPFVGGCGVISARASLDSDETEIWVPELDLLNRVQGAQDFQESFATIYGGENGLVWWKRNGVLTVACDLTGIRWFPFDHPGCSMDFGSSRSPQATQVNYIIDPTITGSLVEFSDRLIQKTAKYQEYQVDVNRTKVTVETETMSFYTNKFIRFQFYFDRSVSYYLWTHVVLYILLTYLSFGMFFLDQQVGERLGFGTGILFVIVAEDITISERTPITQVRLWIDNLSFGSKVFIILAIVESLVILYYYFINDFDGSGTDNVVVKNDEEREEEKNKTIEMQKLIARVDSDVDNRSKQSIDEECLVTQKQVPATSTGRSTKVVSSNLVVDEKNCGVLLSSDEQSEDENSFNDAAYHSEKGQIILHSSSIDLSITSSSNNNCYVESSSEEQKKDHHHHRQSSGEDVDDCSDDNANGNNNDNSNTPILAGIASPRSIRNPHRRQRRRILKLGKCSRWLLRNIFGYDDAMLNPVSNEKSNIMKQKVLKLRLWDRITAIIFFSTYTIFLLIMFILATNRN